MNLLDSVDFRISVVGDQSSETYAGDFKSLKRLSHRQELLRDRMYRELLGPNPEGASERAKSQAEIISDLHVCLVSTPEWWKQSGSGLDLVDSNVLREIWDASIRIRVEAIEETKKKAAEASEKLKAAADQK